MYKADTHIHSKYSFDSTMRLDSIVKKAEDKGLDYIAITDHVEFSNQPVKEVVARLSARNKMIDSISKNTPIKVLKGIEVSEPHHYKDEMKYMYELKGLDYILGSVHHILGMPIKKMSSRHNAYDLYLNSILKMVNNSNIDTLAHLDYIKRNIKNGVFNEDTIREILLTIIDRNINLEINSSGIRRCDEFFPSDEILKMYVELGGKKVTIGSDAHKESEIYDHVEEAYEHAKILKLTPGIVQKRHFTNM